MLTRAGWERDTRVGAFEGGGIGFGGAAGRNVGHRRDLRPCRTSRSAADAAPSSPVGSPASPVPAPAPCWALAESPSLVHATGVRPRLGRIPRSPAFPRPGLVRVSGGGGPSALTRLSIRAFAATFTGLSATLVPRRISFASRWTRWHRRRSRGHRRHSTGRRRRVGSPSLCRRAGRAAISTLLGLGLPRATHLRGQLALRNDLLAGLLHRVGEIPHLGAGRLIALTEPGRGVTRRFLETIGLRLHRLRGALQVLGEPLTRSRRQLSSLGRGLANLLHQLRRSRRARSLRPPARLTAWSASAAASACRSRRVCAERSARSSTSWTVGAMAAASTSAAEGSGSVGRSMAGVKGGTWATASSGRPPPRPRRNAKVASTNAQKTTSTTSRTGIAGRNRLSLRRVAIALAASAICK